MKKQILNLGKGLGKAEQRKINGGGPKGPPTEVCIGTGTGGVWSVGYSSACIGHDNGTDCTIDGQLAACNGIGGEFWFY